MAGLLAVLALVILILLWLGGVYNRLVNFDVLVDQAWGQVETQYQRRADLVPQLVSTVQGSADFESTTLLEVTEARTNWLNASQGSAGIGEQITAANAFDSAISRLLVTVESYPTLRSSENFLALQSQLEGTENRISVARQDYNIAATNMNRAVRSVPTNIVAAIFGFDEEVLFESNPGSENAPEVDFDF